ncbi:pyridine nucleotide-disulfide oxidoreductase [Salmonella enterica subsp. enterica serovar Typhimurium]|nr:pyridine nucleotide-disulfide oxidoreductase [Salmonella enterica subsp. enterica serovar Typhimurium]
MLRGEKIFINTGAESVIPAITGLTTTAGVFDSTGLLSLSQRPARLGILGGGYIGLEFASMFANFGTKSLSLKQRRNSCLVKIGISRRQLPVFYRKRASS